MLIDKAPALNIERVGNGVIVRYTSTVNGENVYTRGYTAADFREYTVVFESAELFTKWMMQWWYNTTIPLVTEKPDEPA